MTIKRLTLKNDLFTSSGRDPSDGVPLRWLESLVQQMEAQVPDEQERKTMTVYGAEHLTVQYDHALTVEESLQEALAEQRLILAKVKDILPLRPGENATLSADQLKLLGQLLP